MHLLNPPDEETFERIKKELGEDDERFKHNVDHIENWINLNPRLPKNYDKRIISKFLRGCKHDLERTKAKIETYFTVRTTTPEFYSQRDPNNDALVTVSKIMYSVPLPTLTPEGYRVVVHRLKDNYDVSSFEPKDIFTVNLMIGDIRVVEEVPLAGDVYIMDCRNLTIAHCTKYISPLLKKLFAIATNAYPQRVQAIHMPNAPAFMDKTISIIKPMLKEKLRNRFIIHRGTETLKDYIPEEVLPEEYGGKAGSLTELHDKWVEYLNLKAGWFKQQESVVATGPISAKMSRQCGLDSDYGVNGSFRKLMID